MLSAKEFLRQRLGSDLSESLGNQTAFWMEEYLKYVNMRVVIVDERINAINYGKPNLFINSEGLILLSDGKRSNSESFGGFVIKSPDKSIYTIGSYFTQWDKNRFQLFKGSVTLSNE